MWRVGLVEVVTRGGDSSLIGESRPIPYSCKYGYRKSLGILTLSSKDLSPGSLTM